MIHIYTKLTLYLQNICQELRQKFSLICDNMADLMRGMKIVMADSP